MSEGSPLIWQLPFRESGIQVSGTNNKTFDLRLWTFDQFTIQNSSRHLSGPGFRFAQQFTISFQRSG